MLKRLFHKIFYHQAYQNSKRLFFSLPKDQQEFIFEGWNRNGKLDYYYIPKILGNSDSISNLKSFKEWQQSHSQGKEYCFIAENKAG